MIDAEQTVKCDYCHKGMSIIEGITEFGKWYHQDCMIYKLGSEIDQYKKKWIDGKLSKGDKVDLLELVNLRQNMIADRTEFKGFGIIEESIIKRNMLTVEPQKEFIYLDEHGQFPLLKDGKMVYVEDKAPSIEMRIPKIRPIVRALLSPKRKQIEMNELPKLLGVGD